MSSAEDEALVDAYRQAVLDAYNTDYVVRETEARAALLKRLEDQRSEIERLSNALKEAVNDYRFAERLRDAGMDP